jgi:hypothetical protein
MSPEFRLLCAIYGVDPNSDLAGLHSAYHAQRNESCPEAHGVTPIPCSWNS